MKIGIISDIHSNIIALKACIAYMKAVPCDEYLFLGDYISDAPYTRETMDYLYDFSSKNNCLFLRGNREDYMLEQRKAIAQDDENAKWRWDSASGNLLFTYEQLFEKDFAFFESPVPKNRPSGCDHLPRLSGKFPGKAACGGRKHQRMVKKHPYGLSDLRTHPFAVPIGISGKTLL